jgi:aryl-alcohol dehydrogenase-like predicted oxidoreductase
LHKQAILAYSPLQRGLLTGKVGADYTFKPTDHRSGNPFFKQANREKVNQFLCKIKPLGQHLGLSLPQLVLAWTIARPGITAALVGARNVAQVEENAGAVTITPGREELDKIDCLLTPLLDQLEL